MSDSAASSGPAPSAARRAILWLFALASIVGVGLFVRHRTETGRAAAASGSASGERVVAVPTAKVVARDVTIVLEGLGTVAPYQSVIIKTQVEGRLDKVHFIEGQLVKKGDLLAEIDPRPFAIQHQLASAQLARDKATLVNARIALARNEKLLAQGVGSQQAVDDAKAEVAKGEAVLGADNANIASAALNLALARIRSPIDGVTGVRLVDAGNVVRPGDLTGLVLVTQIDPIVVFFNLPEDELPRVQSAMAKEQLVVEAWGREGQTKLATGTLALVDNLINTSTATIRLKAVFANAERQLWPNQFVRAKLRLATKKGALVVPSTVVQRGPQGAFAYVVEGDTVSIRPVEVELTQGDQSIVAKGLSAGEIVVVDGQNQLRPGAKIASSSGKGKPP